MNLKHVTFTGADDSCRPEELVALSRHYLFVEWGILVSRSRFSTPRYPGLAWINDLQAAFKGTPHKLALHVCGHFVRQLLLGTNELPPEFVQGFERVQLNFHGQALKFEPDACAKALAEAFTGKQVIFQVDGAMGADYLREIADDRQAFGTVALFDVSHGGGKLPGVWPTFAEWGDDYRGYAGGLGPDNLEEQLPRIELAAGGRDYWVDMETKVRGGYNGETFDLNAVRACCDIAHRFLNPPTPAAQPEAA